MGVEVVNHEHHFLSLGVVDGEHLFDQRGQVQAGSPRQRFDSAASGQGLDPHKDRACFVAHIFGVLKEVTAAGACGDRIAGMPKELVGLLVHTHH